MDFENYVVFNYTKEQLEKNYSKSVLDKYYKLLGFLYQNGFELNCKENEIDEQLSFWNYFQTTDDFDELCKTIDVDNSFEFGRNIISNEFLNILKDVSFIKQELDNPMVIKIQAESNWKNIENAIYKLKNVILSNDLEVNGFLKTYFNKQMLEEKLNEIVLDFSKDLKIITWKKFGDFINNIYSVYLQSSKQKNEKKFVNLTNINEELYGIGGYNPNTKEIKCSIGSAVSNIKVCYSSKSLLKTKALANIIFKENKIENDDDNFVYLKRWLDGKENNDNKAKQIVINACLWGVFDLLLLKHGINFYDLKNIKNEKIYINFMDEMKAIMNYCNINKEYLL